MSMDKNKLKVLNKLFDGGFGTEKEILGIGIPEVVLLKLTPEENEILFNLQNAIKSHRVVSFLSGSQE